MGCKDKYELIMYADGGVLPRPRHDYGCAGEIRRYSVTTTIPDPVSYRWSVDDTHIVLSTKPYLDYVFDDKKHNIVCSADGPSCGIGISAWAFGTTCTKCPMLCNTQTVLIPPGEIISLTDETGKIYLVTNGTFGACRDKANQIPEREVKQAIKAKTKCFDENFKVALYNNKQGPTCISLTITNSYVRFTKIKVDHTEYTFNTNNC